MSLDIDEALATKPAEPAASASTGPGRRCGRHSWTTWSVDATGGQIVVDAYCYRCGVKRDPERAARGKSSARLGKDQERRIERIYGPRKVGEHGDAIDLLGATWKWQSKASRGKPPLWLAAINEPVSRTTAPRMVIDSMVAMGPLAPHLRPLVILTFVRNGGLAEDRTRDWIIVRASDWEAEHGGEWEGLVVMSGTAWLDTAGRDEP